ncbi:MAG: hypothetical protein DMG03_02960 [Acidobacteria bacterium]|nr:MAG: hypothetical protein DMG03_02960 [Acidobacteriota bacterium]
MSSVFGSCLGCGLGSILASSLGSGLGSSFGAATNGAGIGGGAACGCTDAIGSSSVVWISDVSISATSSSSPDNTFSRSLRASSADAKLLRGSSCSARAIQARRPGGIGSSSPVDEFAHADDSTSAICVGYSSSVSSRPRISDSDTMPTCVTSVR